MRAPHASPTAAAPCMAPGHSARVLLASAAPFKSSIARAVSEVCYLPALHGAAPVSACAGWYLQEGARRLRETRLLAGQWVNCLWQSTIVRVNSSWEGRRE